MDEVEWVLGIDPGLDGGIGLLPVKGDQRISIESGTVGPVAFITPIKKLSKSKRDIDARALNKLLRPYNIVLAVVEVVHAMPLQGVSSMFAFGKGYGKVLAVVEIRKWPLEQPTPQRWKKDVLRDTLKDKDAAVAYVRRRFPNVNLLPTSKSTKHHHGMAEAICLAEYGRRLYLGGQQQ